MYNLILFQHFVCNFYIFPHPYIIRFLNSHNSFSNLTLSLPLLHFQLMKPHQWVPWTSPLTACVQILDPTLGHPPGLRLQAWAVINSPIIVGWLAAYHLDGHMTHRGSPVPRSSIRNSVKSNRPAETTIRVTALRKWTSNTQ